jgi:hypothetical protein
MTAKSAAKPAADAPSKSKATAKPDAPAKPPAAKPAQAAKTAATIDPAARWRLIAELAWLKFEARGHQHGHHEQDWLDAEREVDARLAGG